MRKENEFLGRLAEERNISPLELIQRIFASGIVVLEAQSWDAKFYRKEPAGSIYEYNMLEQNNAVDQGLRHIALYQPNSFRLNQLCVETEYGICATSFLKELLEKYADKMSVSLAEMISLCHKKGVDCWTSENNGFQSRLVSSFDKMDQVTEEIVFSKIEYNSLLKVLAFKHKAKTRKLYRIKQSHSREESMDKLAPIIGISNLEVMQRILACGLVVVETWLLDGARLLLFHTEENEVEQVASPFRL